MRTSLTFLKYVSKKFTLWFLTVSFVFSVVLSLFNMIEILRRSYNKSHIGLKQVSLLAIYQLPDLLTELMPFIMLFSAMLLLWHMNRYSELVVARSLGLSIWAIMCPVWLTILGFSLLNFAVFNPISAEFSARFEQMEKQLLTGRSSFLMISQSGLWLKQEEENNYSLIRVARLDQSKKDLKEITLYSFDADNHFVNRLDAQEVQIHPQGWLLKQALLSEANHPPRYMGDLLWKTDLTVHKIQESFSSPATIPLWKIPAFIQLMESAGLSSLEHMQHFYTESFAPFLYLTMATLAGICAYHFTRRKGGLHFVITGLVLGFFIFFLHRISHAMGLSMTMPLFFSVFAPVLIGVLSSVSLLLHLEDR